MKTPRLRIVLVVVLLLVIAGIFVFVVSFGGDCVWGAPVAAWIDLNRNGIHEPDEPPLENVEYQVNDTWNNYKDVGHKSIRQTDGQEVMVVWLPGCPWARFEVEAKAPQGYELTTKSPIEATGWRYGDERLFEFGFAPIEP